MGVEVSLAEVRRSYGGAVVVDGVSLDIAAGEFFTLLGPSGSGKTTTLMMVAGFVEPEAGIIRIGGRAVVDLPPEKRNLGVVFQSYALFPNMSVGQNIGYPLRMRGVARREMERRIEAALALVDLAGSADRRIGQLSGGQQQRVALARAIVFEPPVLLMDEPLGALDRKLREQLQAEIKQIQQNLGVTVIYVTHDQDEALTLSDRIAVMADGRVQQVGKPSEVYENPANLFVAGFLGESNILACDRIISALAGPALRKGAAQLMVRPESVTLLAADTARSDAIAGTVLAVDYLGSAMRYLVETAAGRIVARVTRGQSPRAFMPRETVQVSWRAQDVRLFDPQGRAL